MAQSLQSMGFRLVVTPPGSEHFIWSADGLSIVGLTPIGRATVTALVLNRERVLNIRAADKAIKRHPPPGDFIQSES